MTEHKNLQDFANSARKTVYLSLENCISMVAPVNVDTVVLHHLVLGLPGDGQATCQELVILLDFLDEACYLNVQH